MIVLQETNCTTEAQLYYVYPKVLRNIFLEKKKNSDPGGMMTAWIAVLPIKIAPKWVNITKYSLQKTPHVQYSPDGCI